MSAVPGVKPKIERTFVLSFPHPPTPVWGQPPWSSKEAAGPGGNQLQSSAGYFHGPALPHLMCCSSLCCDRDSPERIAESAGRQGPARGPEDGAAQHWVTSNASESVPVRGGGHSRQVLCTPGGKHSAGKERTEARPGPRASLCCFQHSLGRQPRVHWHSGCFPRAQ